MMGNVVNLFPERVTTDEPFGGCPKCGKLDYYLNVGRDHWAVCDTHRAKWHIGSNLFSSWHHETEADWQRNRYRLAEYVSVDSICPEPTEASVARAAQESTTDLPF